MLLLRGGHARGAVDVPLPVPVELPGEVVGAGAVVEEGSAAAPTTPVPSIPSARAVAIVRSQLALWAYGPRSITGTVITLPF